MEYTEIKDWLDKLVDNLQQQNELVVFNNQIKTFYPNNYILISSGIELIAEIMGICLTEIINKDRKFPYIYHFMYKGICFKQIEEERLVSTNVQV